MEFKYLEYHVCDHCNLNCVGCFHCAPLVREPVFRSVNQFKADCFQLKTLLPANYDLHFVLLGGEPLLHPQLLDFIEASQELIPVTGIVTNGILLKSQPQHFFDVINKYNISIRWSNYYDDIEIVKLLKDKVNRFLILDATKLIRKNYNFNRIYNYDKRLFYYTKCGDIGNNWNCVTLRDGFLYRCAWEAWSDYLINYFNINPINYSREANRLNIFNINNIDEINNFINEPSDFCNYCIDAFSRAPAITNWKVSKLNLREWVQDGGC